jgi:hypothetical protein
MSERGWRVSIGRACPPGRDRFKRVIPVKWRCSQPALWLPPHVLVRHFNCGPDFAAAAVIDSYDVATISATALTTITSVATVMYVQRAQRGSRAKSRPGAEAQRIRVHANTAQGSPLRTRLSSSSPPSRWSSSATTTFCPTEWSSAVDRPKPLGGARIRAVLTHDDAILVRDQRTSSIPVVSNKSRRDFGRRHTTRSGTLRAMWGTTLSGLDRDR